MKRTFLFTVIMLAISSGIALAGMELTSARVYVKQREWLKALQFYNVAIQKEPENLEAYEERGEVLHTMASDTTLGELAKQVVTDKMNPQGELYDRMLADFNKATIPVKPDDAATVKKLKKKIDDVLQRTWQHFYFQALQSDSNYIKATDAGTKDPNPKVHLYSALRDLDMAIKLLPDKWNAYGFKAQLLTKLDSTAASAENWKLTLKCITSADKSKLDDEQRKAYSEGEKIAREALLISYYNMGKTNEVLTTADEILKTDPDNVNGTQLKMEVLRRMSEDTTLTTERRAALEKETMASARELARISDKLMTEKVADETPDMEAARIKEAITMKAQALAQMARDASLSKEDRKKLESDAVAALHKVLESRPNDLDIMYSIGQFNLQLGDTAAAITSFTDYLKVNDTAAKDHGVNFALGVLYLERGAKGDLEKARDVFKHLTDLYPDDGPSWINYGVTLVRLGDTAKGSEYIKKGKALGEK